MNKHIINIFLSAALMGGSAVALSSCQDELDVTPDGRMTMEDVFNNPENTKAYFASAW